MTSPFLSPNSPLAGILGGIAAAPAPAPMPAIDVSTLGVELLPYQVEGVQFAIAKRNAYIGDEMGLGKTFQAIAAVALDGAYPALVICPPSLTLNWRNEIRRLVPGARIAVLSGTKPALPEQADFYVVGDAVLAKWAGLRSVAYTKRNGEKGKKDVADGVLSRIPFKALVIDEAHRFKTWTAQRTRAAQAVAALLPARAMRILMSGTAIVNRPSELSTQIRIAGVDSVFGGWYSFLNRYAPVIDRWGGRGSAHLDELNAKMVSTFYLRRLRSQVLSLPGKGRVTIATAMNGRAARDYMRAQDDLIAYVRDERGAKAAQAAGKAEALVLLGTLRRLIGSAKVEAVISYVQDLVDEGESVFVAAWHADVVEAIHQAFPGSVTIRGSDNTQAKQAAVESFQAGTTKVLVGNIVAAGVGFTLTAARHIVVAELPWTPGDLKQVEDRLDRIGQTRAVVSHLMLGANGVPTVDERLMAILNDKAAVTGMVLDGEAGSIIDDESITAALLDSYREGAY